MNSNYMYRRRNKPDDHSHALDVVPIYPSRDMAYRNHHMKSDFHREIAFAIDYRGANDDVPTILIHGAGYTLVKKVFMDMFGRGSYLFSGFRLYRDMHIYQRQRKAWVRIAIELRNYKSSVTSVGDLMVLIGNRMKRECLCTVKYINKTDKFLNL